MTLQDLGEFPSDQEIVFEGDRLLECAEMIDVFRSPSIIGGLPPKPGLIDAIKRGDCTRIRMAPVVDGKRAFYYE